MLLRRVPSFVDLSIRCLQHGFSCPLPLMSSSSSSELSMDPLSKTIDIGLVSISLAILFAVLDRNDLCKALTEECIKKMIEECVRNLVDPRLVSSNESSLTKEKSIVQNQISKGLNAIILKLSCSENIRSGMLMHAIIENLLLCIPEKNHSVRKFFIII